MSRASAACGARRGARPAGARGPSEEDAPVPDGFHRARARSCCSSGSRPSSSRRARTTRQGRRACPGHVPRARDTARRAPERGQVRRHVVHASASSSCGTRRRTASTASRAPHGLRRAVGGGLPLRLRGDLLLRPRGRRVHHRDDEDRGDPDRDRPARAALPPQRLGADRDPDGRLRARRHDLRDVGGDARLLRRCSCRSRSRSATTAWSRRRSSSSAPAPA